MKKLLLFFLFLATPAYAIESAIIGTMWKQEGTVVSPADDVTSVTGVGGVSEGTDVDFNSVNVGAGITGTETDPSLSFGDGNTGFYEIFDNTLRFSSETLDTLEFKAAYLQGLRAANGPRLNLTVASAGDVIYTFVGDTDTGTTRPAADQYGIKVGDVEGARIYKNGVDLKVGIAFSAISSISADYVMGNFTTDPTFFIECDAALGNISTTLPLVADKKGRLLEVNLVSAANGCYLDGNGAETISGEAGKAITIQYNSVSLIAGSTQWLIY